mmetsp:Transcript_34984/g.68878  ORF Transcript_34984/g.68878 Transcript_34984/m.68878 type:complete len:293 (+) Transcript_34984:667-1545(+)
MSPQLSSSSVTAIWYWKSPSLSSWVSSFGAASPGSPAVPSCSSTMTSSSSIVAFSSAMTSSTSVSGVGVSSKNSTVSAALPTSSAAKKGIDGGGGTSTSFSSVAADDTTGSDSGSGFFTVAFFFLGARFFLATGSAPAPSTPSFGLVFLFFLFFFGGATAAASSTATPSEPSSDDIFSEPARNMIPSPIGRRIRELFGWDPPTLRSPPNARVPRRAAYSSCTDDRCCCEESALGLELTKAVVFEARWWWFPAKPLAERTEDKRIAALIVFSRNARFRFIAPPRRWSLVRCPL